MLTADLPTTLERLVDLGRNPDVNIRPVLLRVLVDLFVSRPNHPEAALRQFEEIVGRLLEDADEAVRLIVADKLAGHAQAPEAVLRRLLADRREAASAVLARAPLNGSLLQASAALGTVEMAVSVAGRSDLDIGTVRALADRPEPAVLAALADNTAVALDPKLWRYLVRRARDDAAVAAKLLKRDCDPIEVSALFLDADRGKRLSILAALRRHDLGRAGSEPMAGAAEACEQIARIILLPGRDGLDLVLCQALDLPAPVAERIVDDPGGEPLAVALAALGASPELTARVFILGPSTIGHVYATVKALVGIVETVSPIAARRLIASLSGQVLPARSTQRSETRHERSHAPAERRQSAQAEPALRMVG